MQVAILTPDELTREEIDTFWDQDVCMDDWDYLVLAPADSIELVTQTDSWNHSEYQEWEQQDWAIDRLLTGCCSNHWYKATFRGQEYAIGIAYHA